MASNHPPKPTHEGANPKSKPSSTNTPLERPVRVKTLPNHFHHGVDRSIRGFHKELSSELVNNGQVDLKARDARVELVVHLGKSSVPYYWPYALPHALQVMEADPARSYQKILPVLGSLEAGDTNGMRQSVDCFLSHLV